MPRTKTGTFWQRDGRRGGPGVVLIHGLGLNLHLWAQMRPALEDRYDVISYDLYGHGQSAPAPARPSLAVFSEQLAELLDEFAMARAAIIGFSLGGMIARRFAQDYPDRASALVILNSAHRRSDAAQRAIEARVAQARRDGPAATVDAALERWFTDRFRAGNPAMMAKVRNWILANDPEIYTQNYEVLAKGVAEITEPGRSLDHPALVMTAQEDWGNSPEMTRAIAAGMPRAKALILPQLRHMALAEDPEAVNAPVRQFLDEQLVSG